MCNHAFFARHAAAISLNGSNDPELICPACAITITGPLAELIAATAASASIAPFASTSTVISRRSPNPRYFSPAKMVECASAPRITVIGGDPAIPSDSRSHPARRSISERAAARQVKPAIVAPVTNPTDDSRGKSISSSNAAAAAASAAEAEGVAKWLAVFCPQADVSQSAATPTGLLPPMTQPKKRGPVIAARPGSAMPISSLITCSAGAPSRDRSRANLLTCAS